MASIISDLEDKVSKLKEDVENAQSRSTALEDQIQLLQGDKDRLYEEATEYKAQAQDAVAQSSSQQAKLENLQDSLEHRTQTVKQLQRNLDDLKESHKKVCFVPSSANVSSFIPNPL